MLSAQHGLFGGEVSFVCGALHQHHAPRYILGSEDVRRARLQVLVHPDVDTLDLHTCGLQVQSLHVAEPTDRDHDGFRVERAFLAVPSVEKPELPVPFRIFSIPLMPVMISIRRFAKASATPCDTTSPSTSRRLGAASSSHTREPNAANTEATWQPVAAPPTTDRAGQVLHGPDVAVGHGVLAAGEGQPPRVAASTEDKLLALQILSVAERERVRVEKASVACAVKHAHARCFELIPQLLLLANRVHDVLRTVQQPDETHFGRFALEPVPSELLRAAHEPRGPGQHAGWDACVVGADSAMFPRSTSATPAPSSRARKAVVTLAGRPPLPQISSAPSCRVLTFDLARGNASRGLGPFESVAPQAMRPAFWVSS